MESLEHFQNEEIRWLLNLPPILVDASDGSGMCKDKRKQRRPQSYELGASRYQTTRISKEDVETTDQRGNEGGRGHWIWP